jgi:hypothetical protein
MDTASAQTKADAFGSSNQSITSNMILCSNMFVPTAAFFAELQQVAAGPVVGLAGFEFVQGQDELFYELLVRGTLHSFSVSCGEGDQTFGFQDVTSSKVGAIPSSGAGPVGIPGPALTCEKGVTGGMALPTLYSGFADGGSSVRVFVDGTELQGAIVPLDLGGPFARSFRFVGRH